MAHFRGKKWKAENQVKKKTEIPSESFQFLSFQSTQNAKVPHCRVFGVSSSDPQKSPSIKENTM